MPKEEFTGQLIGGPDHGNLVSSDSSSFRAAFISLLYLEGDGRPPAATEVTGRYDWDPTVGVFRWKLDRR